MSKSSAFQLASRLACGRCLAVAYLRIAADCGDPVFRHVRRASGDATWRHLKR